jgi:hypothetical protein
MESIASLIRCKTVTDPVPARYSIVTGSIHNAIRPRPWQDAIALLSGYLLKSNFARPVWDRSRPEFVRDRNCRWWRLRSFFARISHQNNAKYQHCSCAVRCEFSAFAAIGSMDLRRRPELHRHQSGRGPLTSTVPKPARKSSQDPHADDLGFWRHGLSRRYQQTVSAD